MEKPILVWNAFLLMRDVRVLSVEKRDYPPQQIFIDLFWKV
jgi:hypothetical protein